MLKDAELTACQTPDKSGLPSAARGTTPACAALPGAWAEAGAHASHRIAITKSANRPGMRCVTAASCLVASATVVDGIVDVKREAYDPVLYSVPATGLFSRPVHTKELTMRATSIRRWGLLALGLSAVVGIDQARGAQQPPQQTLGGMTLRLAAPTNKSVAWPASNVSSGFQEMVQQKLESQRILEGGVFNFNLRRETAAEAGATAHGKKSDLYLIRSGEATLTTDGELIAPTAGNGAEGDVNGTGIRNGIARVVKAGDTIFIPARVPHQITAVNGEVQFLLFRWDTK
jgi:mannose-6-phosphate isomerase-like protein (cupin superfamily)